VLASLNCFGFGLLRTLCLWAAHARRVDRAGAVFQGLRLNQFKERPCHTQDDRSQRPPFAMQLSETTSKEIA